MVVGNHHVDRGRGVVRQPSAIIAIAIDSALATGEDKNRTLARDQSRQGRNMCMREQARACWRRTAAWARTLRRSRPCPSPRTSTSEAAASVEAAREKAEAVAEVGAAEVLGLAALAASAVARRCGRRWETDVLHHHNLASRQGGGLKGTAVGGSCPSASQCPSRWG